jgi:hypothetical protein
LIYWLTQLNRVQSSFDDKRYFCATAAEMANDSSRGLYHARVMDERAIRRAALVTLRPAVCERFPPGPVRARCLRWMDAKGSRPMGASRS